MSMKLVKTYLFEIAVILVVTILSIIAELPPLSFAALLALEIFVLWMHRKNILGTKNNIMLPGKNFSAARVADELEPGDILHVLVQITEREGKWTRVIVPDESRTKLIQRLRVFEGCTYKYYIRKLEDQ